MRPPLVQGTLYGIQPLTVADLADLGARCRVRGPSEGFAQHLRLMLAELEALNLSDGVALFGSFHKDGRECLQIALVGRRMPGCSDRGCTGHDPPHPPHYVLKNLCTASEVDTVLTEAEFAQLSQVLVRIAPREVDELQARRAQGGLARRRVR
jgi:hypothetical protein